MPGGGAGTTSPASTGLGAGEGAASTNPSTLTMAPWPWRPHLLRWHRPRRRCCSARAFICVAAEASRRIDGGQSRRRVTPGGHTLGHVHELRIRKKAVGKEPRVSPACACTVTSYKHVQQRSTWYCKLVLHAFTSRRINALAQSRLEAKRPAPTIRQCRPRMLRPEDTRATH